METVPGPLSLAVALLILVSGCGRSSAGSDLDLVRGGTLTVCSDVPFPPFEDFDQGSALGFKGFDVDLDKLLAADLGLKLRIKDSDFDALQSGRVLDAGDCDLVSSALTITPDREEKLGFSAGYYDSEQSLLVPTGSTITTLGDLAGKRVGVQRASTGASYTEQNAPRAGRVEFSSDDQLYAALEAGKVDALLQDLPTNLNHQNDPAQPGRFKVVQTYKTDEQYGLAMKKTNTDLISAVDAALARIRSDGSYQKLYDRYFSTD